MYRSLLLVLAVLTMCIGQVSTQGLIAWYPFNGNANNGVTGAGALVAPYVSTENQVATFTKAPSHTNDSNAMKLLYANGLYGDAAPLPKGNSNRTISVWVWYSMGVSLPYNILKYGSTSPGKSFNLFIGTTAGSLCIVSNGTDALTLINEVPRRVWTHVAVVIKGDTTWGYVGGNLVAYQRITTWNTEDLLANNVLIGGRNGANQTYEGAIDDIAIYNRALTASEVRQLYQASPYLTGTVPTVAHLSQVTQPAARPYTVLANGQVVRQQPGNLRRLFNLFK